MPSNHWRHLQNVKPSHIMILWQCHIWRAQKINDVQNWFLSGVYFACRTLPEIHPRNRAKPDFHHHSYHNTTENFREGLRLMNTFETLRFNNNKKHKHFESTRTWIPLSSEHLGLWTFINAYINCDIPFAWNVLFNGINVMEIMFTGVTVNTRCGVRKIRPCYSKQIDLSEPIAVSNL